MEERLAAADRAPFAEGSGEGPESQGSGPALTEDPATPVAAAAEPPEESLDPGRAASLVRRMLAVYRRTGGLE